MLGNKHDRSTTPVYSQAETGRELTQPRKHLLAEPCTSSFKKRWRMPPSLPLCGIIAPILLPHVGNSIRSRRSSSFLLQSCTGVAIRRVTSASPCLQNSLNPGADFSGDPSTSYSSVEGQMASLFLPAAKPAGLWMMFGFFLGRFVK